MATFWGCKCFLGSQSAAIFALTFSIPFAYFYRNIDIYGRNFNIRIMHFVESGIHKQKYWKISIGIFFSLFLFAMRLFLFYSFAMYVGDVIYSGLYLQLLEFVVLGLQNAWYLLPIVGFTLMIKEFNIFRKIFVRNFK